MTEDVAAALRGKLAGNVAGNMIEVAESSAPRITDLLP